ncbi:basic blue protein-like [Pyrus ussuriensis x Pyrus communis]|uniref:Basic blue protein-like n=1 Tax=Pyrus ussuriensis x Pyrus communis TaxID=2448454 RepID=A0A5N5I8T2_9ROSA|nr:basic blue protein-like [Pyrus ussuriensis x Pyrus communis]
MSHQGRCSVTQANVHLLFLFLTIVSAQKTTFTVGDKSGWTFNVENWTDGKKFKAGDELVFNYDPSLHNVAVVDANEYSSCNPVKLSKGLNYFICTVPGHCDADVKISVNAS